jgi:hypothetical protein
MATVTDPTTGLPASPSTALANIYALIVTETPETTISVLSLTVSDPPTQAECQAIADKLDELILLLKESGLIL